MLEVIVSLVRVRLLVGDTDPLPLADKYLSEWSGGAVTPREVREAKRFLKNAGRLLAEGEAAAQFGRATILWRLVP